MKKIRLSESNINKLKELIDDLYSSKYHYYKLDEICLFCETPTKSTNISLSDLIYLNILPDLKHKYNLYIDNDVYESVDIIDKLYYLLLASKKFTYC